MHGGSFTEQNQWDAALQADCFRRGLMDRTKKSIKQAPYNDYMVFFEPTRV